ncbi:MAG: hypothetical protein LBP40_06265 [Campylobacteraceae bacterium]|nr:hypothetical protein [Campylobacteraceae bacterium]
MMINVRLAAAVFTAVELLFAAFFLYGGAKWFLNAQFGFLGFGLIVIGSFLGYKKMVNYRVSMYENEPDIIDNTYELWDEEDKSESKNEKTSALSTAAKNTKTSVKGFFSPYRMTSYALFFIVFFVLVKSGALALVPFIAGIMCAPLGVLIYEALRIWLFNSADKI